MDDRTVEVLAVLEAWVRSYLTEDASVEYPPGSATGVEAIAALIDGPGMAPFQLTHDVTTNYLIDLDGHHARVRFNLIATHVHSEAPQRSGDAPGAQFIVGDYCQGEVVRTGAGWRFSSQALYVTWFDGPPPSM
jgi:SnoaL-like domain